MRKAVATQTWEMSVPDPLSRAKESIIHPSAVIDPTVILAEDVTIHANVVIERGARTFSQRNSRWCVYW